MAISRGFAAASIAALVSVTLVAQAEKFEGEFEVDRGKVKQLKRIALVDVMGETKNSMGDHVEPWTNEAFKLLADAWRKAGVEVVAGPDVAAAFNAIVPMPTIDDLKAVLKKKTRMTDSEIEATANHAAKNWGDEPGEAAKYGYKIFRPEGSINLERPLLTQQDYSGKRPEEKEVQRRLAVLREKLGVDAVARVEYGFGSWRYEEPGYQKANRAQGKSPGLIGGISALRGFAKGTRASAYFNIEVYSADGKKQLVNIVGSCQSKEGTGLKITNTESKVEAMMPAAVSGCIDNIFKKLADD